MGRKDRENIGVTTAEAKEAEYSEPAGASVGKSPIVMPERLFLAILRDEVERLSDTENEDILTRFFSHFFDPMISVAERNTYIRNFQQKPPTVVGGYPRVDTARFPCVSIVLLDEKESEPGALDHLVGSTLSEDKPTEAEEFIGAMFDQTFGIFVYAENPDVCIYLYHLVKLLLLGSHELLEACGIIDPEYSGGEMAPDEGYLPENMFVRVLKVSLKSLQTVPYILRPDPRRIRMTGIFATDIVVSGMRGGVSGT
jgi:hypothetical protein